MTTKTLHVGPLAATLTFSGDRLAAVDLPLEVPEGLDSESLDEMCARLSAYKCAEDAGGPFVQRVRQRMRSIPRGTVLTYGELAVELENARAFRAVGQACATNRLLLVVPCHRVVGNSGLGGFRLGLDWKRKLLELEAHC